MTWPGLPTDRAGRLIVGPSIDEEVQGWNVTSIAVPENPELQGVWFDDTTPNLLEWVEKGVAKYAPLGMRIFVLVKPGFPFDNWRHPAIVNMHEYYPFHSGTGRRPKQWRVPRCWSIDSDGHRKRGGLVIQWKYPGLETELDPTLHPPPPTRAQKRWELARIRLARPAEVFEF